MAVEQQAQLHTGTCRVLVMPKLPDGPKAAPEIASAGAEPKRGVVIAWPAQVSATFRRVKEAITASNTEALQLFESASVNRP